MINERHVECCKCGWSGTEGEQAQRQSLFLQSIGVDGLDHVCPECGHDDFYVISSTEE